MKLAKISVIAAIVLGGLVACSTVAMAQDAATNAPARKGKGGFSPEQRLERLDKELNLTDAQKPKVKALLEATQKKMTGLGDLTQEERRSKFREIREEENKKMKEILTADQYKKYEEQAQRMRNGKKKKDSQ